MINKELRAAEKAENQALKWQWDSDELKNHSWYNCWCGCDSWECLRIIVEIKWKVFEQDWTSLRTVSRERSTTEQQHWAVESQSHSVNRDLEEMLLMMLYCCFAVRIEYKNLLSFRLTTSSLLLCVSFYIGGCSKFRLIVTTIFADWDNERRLWEDLKMKLLFWWSCDITNSNFITVTFTIHISTQQSHNSNLQWQIFFVCTFWIYLTHMQQFLLMHF